MKPTQDHIDTKYEEGFDQLIKLTIDIGNQLRQQPIPPGDSYVYIEGLGQKIIRHVLSAKFIGEGYQLRIGKEVYEQMMDFGSVMVITRAALEAYLTFHFLFVDPKEPDKKRFRLLCWHIGAFLDRADHEPEQEAHIQLKASEVRELEKYRKELKNNTYYNNSITPKAQEKAFDGEWRIFDGWTKLATSAGFPESFFRQQYRLLCSYSHSGRHSVMQIHDAKTPELQNNMIQASRAILILMLAKFIDDYVDQFPALQLVKKEPSYQLVKFWKHIAETINQDQKDSTE
jgi:Family of unknown function (DUF5677)